MAAGEGERKRIGRVKEGTRREKEKEGREGEMKGHGGGKGRSMEEEHSHMVEGGGLGGLGRGWVILLDRWYFWPTVVRFHTI